MEHSELEVTCAENNDNVDMVQTPQAHEKNPVEGNGDDAADSLLGMEFESEDQAYEFYNEYAAKVGFRIRKSWSNTKDGLVTRRKFCCSREGQRQIDKRRTNVKKHRDETRINCMAHIMIGLKLNGKYVIDRFEATHSHQCTPNKGWMFRSRRLSNAAQAAKTDLADSVGKATFDFMSAQAGGNGNVGFNYLQTKRMKVMEKGDARGVLEYLQGLVVDDPGSMYAIQLDGDDLIATIFWVDSKMVIDYLTFGDVVCFDTTYRTNNYDRPFALFTGINHHRQTIIFGAALMYDETSESFEWLFQAFLKAMSNKHPTTILTDQDNAMANAISIVMPNTYHRICVWHVYQNALKHLNHMFTSSKSFGEDFRRCIFEYDEECDFLEAWKMMLENHNLQEHEWLKGLFDERKRWALAYGRNTFCGDIKSTQRSEDMNSKLRRYLHRSYNLLQFFPHFEGVVSDRRMAEGRADFEMTQSVPVLEMDIPILAAARNVYTPQIFKLFQEEFVKGANCSVRIYSTVDSIITYQVNWRTKNRDYMVTFDCLQYNVECSCKKFEFSGILCGHALRVIDFYGLSEVPERYILKRWRKDAKVFGEITTSESSDDKTVKLARYKVLMHKSMKLNTIAAESSEAFAAVEKGLDNMLTNLEYSHIEEARGEPNEKGCKGHKRMKSAMAKDMNGKHSLNSQSPGAPSKSHKEKRSATEKKRDRSCSSDAQPPASPSHLLMLTGPTAADHTSQASYQVLPTQLLCPSIGSQPVVRSLQMNHPMHLLDQQHQINP